MNDNQSMKERLTEFDASHGNSIVSEHWILFEDGASREMSPYGALISPPKDPWELAKCKAHYCKLVLARAVEAFDERRQWILVLAKANLRQQHCAPPPLDAERAAAELKELRRAVQVAKRAHDKALAEVEAHKPARLRKLEQGDAANRQANEALLSSVNGIEI